MASLHSGQANPTFTIIVPTFNRPSLLREAVDSVLAQSVADFELVVVDDGSSSRPSLPQDPRLVLVQRRSRGGPAAARNTGLAVARGRFICFLDDDDLYTRERLEVILPYLEHGSLIVSWAKYLGAPDSPGRTLDGDVGDSILDATAPHLGTAVVARELIVPFDESFIACEDLDWWLRQTSVTKAITVPRITYLVRRHGAPREGYGTRARLEFSFRLLEKHRLYFATHPRAHAFRWRRIGLMYLSLGDYAAARTAFLRSLRVRPSVRAAWHLARACKGSL